MVRDQPEGPVGDRAPEGSDRRGDVVARLDRLADVVQQGREQELLVIRPGLAGDFEDLEAVVEGIPLGVGLRGSA